MIKVDLLTGANKKAGEVELNPDIFASPVNAAVMHQVVVMQLAKRRSGTASTKNRAIVSGGGRKPWRQKGTGRARAGTIRSPLWVGGGTIFGPTPRDYSQKVPRKMCKLALKSAISSKLKEGNLLVLQDILIDSPRTKTMVENFKNLGIEKKVLVVCAERDENLYKSCRNIPGTKVLLPEGLNAYDILYHDKLIIFEKALAKIEERLK
jgi:large subunit ribosomal protein L4